jgi:phosphatidate cytidylyltransferase
VNFALEKVEESASRAIRSLILRFISALVLVPIVFAAVHVGGRFFPALVAFANLVMIFEWTRMVERRPFSAGFYALAAGAGAAFFAAAAGAYEAAYAICAVSGAAAFALAKRAGRLGLWPAMAAPYIIAPSIALIWLRIDADYGRSLTFMLFMIVWAADTGAFITGKLIGGPKISHALSPSKTWAGIGGGVVGGALGGAAGAAFFWSPAAALAFSAIGAVLGAASVCGDLVESAVKRNFGLKDISGFIPGHGGALDRLDGMIFATAAMTSAVFLYMLAAN